MERDISKYSTQSSEFDFEVEVTDSKGQARAAQGDTNDEAKAKIIACIDANIAFLDGSSTAKLPNRLYSSLDAARVSVGAKYGNAWLQEWIYTDGQLCKFLVVKPADVPKALAQLRTWVEQDWALEEIERIRGINQAAARKRRG